MNNLAVKENNSKFDLSEHHAKLKILAIDGIKSALLKVASLPNDVKIEFINQARILISEQSPFSSEPVDCIQWVKSADIRANDYNPNSVAPPEMELLKHSILMDGYTQPIVAIADADEFEVIDGFHRHRVGKECDEVNQRVLGYLPITIINPERAAKGDRMASTIRHNRARGKHAVDSMSEIVIELKRRNWSDKKVGKELGMDEDEVLRLTQISGLTEMFSDKEFSEAWSAEMYDEPIEVIE